MATTLLDDVLDDDLAVTLANMLAVANRRAKELGVNVEESLITVTQTSCPNEGTWQVNYGPKDYISRRGGDTIIEVEAENRQVRRVLRGQ